jgi:hypothetical protein
MTLNLFIAVEGKALDSCAIEVIVSRNNLKPSLKDDIIKDTAFQETNKYPWNYSLFSHPLKKERHCFEATKTIP